MTRDVKHDPTITLGPKDSAFVVRENGKQEIYFPKDDENGFVPESADVILVIAATLDNEAIMKKAEDLVIATLRKLKEEI